MAYTMRRYQTLTACWVACFLCLTGAAGAQTTAFTYQGQLTDAGSLANGSYDLQFKLFDTVAVGTGTQQGATLVRNPVATSGGVFSVQLDFGANVFDGAARYLEIGVRSVSTTDPYTMLAPRQPVTAAPYAIQTLNAQQLGGLPASRFVQADANGNAGVGIAPNPAYKLDVNGAVLLRPGGSGGGFIALHTPNAETGLTINGNGTTRADLRFDGSTLKLAASTAGIPQPTAAALSFPRMATSASDTTTLTNAQLNVNGFAQDAIVGTSNFGIGVTGQGVFGGVRGFTDTNGSRGVYGISLAGTGVEGSSNGGSNFAVLASGLLGVTQLGTGGNTTMCRNAANQLATCGSSLRYKTDWQPFTSGLKVINRLQPLAFRWKSDHSLDVGFGAEAVAEIEPLLVTHNDQGGVEGVKYDRLSVVFVNAFKEQQAQLNAQAQHLAVQQTQLKQQQQQLKALRQLVYQKQLQALAAEPLRSSEASRVASWHHARHKSTRNRGKR